jgi:hypothetical protein
MKSNEWYRTRARELYQEEGCIEVDPNALVSRGDEAGAYVEAWVWVPLKKEKKKATRSLGLPRS